MTTGRGQTCDPFCRDDDKHTHPPSTSGRSSIPEPYRTQLLDLDEGSELPIVTACAACGALVGDTGQHAAWHLSMSDDASSQTRQDKLDAITHAHLDERYLPDA